MIKRLSQNKDDIYSKWIVLFCISHFVSWLIFSLYTEKMDSYNSYFLPAQGRVSFFDLPSYNHNTHIHWVTFILTKGIGITSYLKANLIFSIYTLLAYFIVFKGIGLRKFSLAKLKLPVVLLYIILLFPIFHFWTARVGKEANILFGLSIIVLSFKYKDFKAVFLLIFGHTLLYMQRPHYCLFSLISIILTYFILSKGSPLVKATFAGLGLFVFGCLLDCFIKSRGFYELNLIEGVQAIIADRSFHIGGYESNDTNIAMEKYIPPFRTLTFLYRPLFEQISLRMILASMENVVFIGITIYTVSKGYVKWIFKSNPQTLFLFLFFIIGSIMMAQISYNFGYASRQKSVLMLTFILTLFPFYYQLNQSKALLDVPNI